MTQNCPKLEKYCFQALLGAFLPHVQGVQVNPYAQRVQNMYGKGGQRVSKAKLRPPEVDPYFERKKITLGGVAKSPAVTILTLEQNPPERIFLYMLNKFSQEDFALRSKLWPNNFS